jgi:hypothetical protein
MTDIAARLRNRSASSGWMDKLDDEAADEIERLRRELSYHAHTDEDIVVQNAEIARLEASNAEMLAVLNAARIVLKNRDQRPNEMKLLDAIKIVIANAEGLP